MLPEQILTLIRNFQGTSISTGTFTELLKVNAARYHSRLKKIGNFTFYTKHHCTCSDACGGIYCEPVKIYSLISVE